MRIAELDTGEAVHRYKKSIVIPFAGKRRVLSTAALNGGYREDLTAVFNQDCTAGAGMACVLKAPTYEEHMALTARELGLDSQTAAGLATAAQMENVSIQTRRWKELAVTAIVTGGIEINGGRVGDLASWHEQEEISSQDFQPGTVNTMVFFNTDLTQGALARALVTCTEAKTAAIQELLAPSRSSMGLATGSGTDGTILAADRESAICLTDTGKHSKAGELAGRAVMAAVKEALCLQTGLSPAYQHQAVRRMERFGINNDVLWEHYTGEKSRAEFEECLEEILGQTMLVTYTSLYAHLLDQLMWGMISPAEAETAGQSLREQMGMEEDMGKEYGFSIKERRGLPEGCSEADARCIVRMAERYGAGLSSLLGKENK